MQIFNFVEEIYALPLSSCKNLAPTFSTVHLLQRYAPALHRVYTMKRRRQTHGIMVGQFGQFLTDFQNSFTCRPSDKNAVNVSLHCLVKSY